jgi:hypothetical protein
LIQRGPAFRNEPIALGRDPDVRLEDALELEQRLVIESDERQVIDPDAALPQAELHGLGRERRITLLAGEPLLGARRDDLAIADAAQRRCRGRTRRCPGSRSVAYRSRRLRGVVPFGALENILRGGRKKRTPRAFTPRSMP